MSAYAKTQRHWRHIAKVNQDSSESSRTIRTQRLEKFTPSKGNGITQQNSFSKSPAKSNFCKQGRFNSPKTTLLQLRQNLTLTNYSSDRPQLLTFIMKSGGLQKKSSNILDNLKASSNSNQQHCRCLFEEMRKSYQQFKSQVMQKLKQYQEYINQQMAKVFEILQSITCMTKQEERMKGESKNELPSFNICLEPEQYLKNHTLKISKSADIIRFVPEKTQQKTRIKEIDNKFNNFMHNKIELIESKQTANFEKFFQIMQKLRDTIDDKATPNKSNSILKERNNSNS